MQLFERIVTSRGIPLENIDSFLGPRYESLHDPFLMPDIQKAVRRLESALIKQEHITIYGDYDIDGISATALLIDAFSQFGFKNVNYYIPNRFDEGFGLSKESIEVISKLGTSLIVTVDCGSKSHQEIELAKKLNIDVIVTDHHEVSDRQPEAIAVINPKREDSKYPFKGLPGVGVAFKLVQALQLHFMKNPLGDYSNIQIGQEKWLLDLVALGTICDVVDLKDENRINAYWGLKVLQKTRRIGLKSLMSVANIEPEKINSRTVGFALGPRMNAAGRLETAKHALELLLIDDKKLAMEKSIILDDFNTKRREEQGKIYQEAFKQAEIYNNQPVLVLSNPNWSHGIVGIVASKILETFKKPIVIFQEMGELSKGSARSYGDFDLSKALLYLGELLKKGGGHKLAAGLTVDTKNIDKIRTKLNEFYKLEKLDFTKQQSLLSPTADAKADLSEVTIEVVEMIHKLEPFGQGNPSPVIKSENLKVIEVKKMGSDDQHLKILLKDKDETMMSFVSFSFPENHIVKVGDSVDVLFSPIINEWRGSRTVEGRIVSMFRL